jgi:hypothetical protein
MQGRRGRGGEEAKRSRGKFYAEAKRKWRRSHLSFDLFALSISSPLRPCIKFPPRPRRPLDLFAFSPLHKISPSSLDLFAPTKNFPLDLLSSSRPYYEIEGEILCKGEEVEGTRGKFYAEAKRSRRQRGRGGNFMRRRRGDRGKFSNNSLEKICLSRGG